MKKSYRWGILGAGRIAEKFCTALNFVEGAEVYAIASRDKEKAKDYASRYNATKWYQDYNALVEDKNVDIIYIATPHAFHYEQTMACLQKGKPVLCEKPMSLGYEQTKEMIAKAADNKLFFMEGMWTACMPFIEKIKDLIASDSIGRPQAVIADFGFVAPQDLDGRLFNKSLGGGSLMDVGVYTLCLATLILGHPSSVKSSTRIGSTGIDEYANMILQYPGGETAQLLSSITFKTAIEATIVGTTGRINIKNPWFKATDISLISNDGTSQDFSMPHASNGFEHEINEVMDCLDKGLLESPKVPHSLTLSVSKIMDEVLRQGGIRY